VQKAPLAVHEKRLEQQSLQEMLNTSQRKRQTLFDAEIRQMLKQGQHLLASCSESFYCEAEGARAYLAPLMEVIAPHLLQAF